MASQGQEGPCGQGLQRGLWPGVTRDPGSRLLMEAPS